MENRDKIEAATSNVIIANTNECTDNVVSEPLGQEPNELKVERDELLKMILAYTMSLQTQCHENSYDQLFDLCTEAENFSLDVKYLLAMLHKNGLGCEKNIATARDLLNEVANAPGQYQLVAKFELAMLHKDDIGCEKSILTARDLLNEVANAPGQCQLMAKFELATLYMQGIAPLTGNTNLENDNNYDIPLALFTEVANAPGQHQLMAKYSLANLYLSIAVCTPDFKIDEFFNARYLYAQLVEQNFRDSVDELKETDFEILKRTNFIPAYTNVDDDEKCLNTALIACIKTLSNELTTLTEINLCNSFNELISNDNFDALINGVTNLKSLKKINLSYNNIGKLPPDKLQKLFEVLTELTQVPNGKLYEIDLSNNQINNYNIECFHELLSALANKTNAVLKLTFSQTNKTDTNYNVGDICSLYNTLKNENKPPLVYLLNGAEENSPIHKKIEDWKECCLNLYLTQHDTISDNLNTPLLFSSNNNALTSSSSSNSSSKVPLSTNLDENNSKISPLYFLGAILPDIAKLIVPENLYSYIQPENLTSDEDKQRLPSIFTHII